MSPNDKRHGTYAGRLAHKRDGEDPCRPCFLAARRAHKSRRIDAQRGRPRTVELGEAAWRVVMTVPMAVIHEQTGIRNAKIVGYRKGGPTKRVHRTTRDRILAVDSWTNVGIQRRLQALSRIGWSMRAAAPVIGVRVDSLKAIRKAEHRDFIRRDVAEKVAAAYETMSMQVQGGRGATRARNDAMRNGWLPPLAWDDIDDPDERPTAVTELHPRSLAFHAQPVDEIVVARLMAGDDVPSTKAEREEAVRRWVAAGGSERSLCQMHDWKPGRYSGGHGEVA